MLEWIGFISTELHKGFGPLFKPDTPDAYKTIAVANLNRRLAYLDEVLAGRSYLVGDRFTVADAYLFTILRWSDPPKFDISGYKNVVAYMARVANREKVQPGAAGRRPPEGSLIGRSLAGRAPAPCHARLGPLGSLKTAPITMLPVSVFIIAKNEADRIGETIRAVRHLTDDLLVVDSGSTDETRGHRRRIRARVSSRTTGRATARRSGSPRSNAAIRGS